MLMRNDLLIPPTVDERPDRERRTITYPADRADTCGRCTGPPHPGHTPEHAPMFQMLAQDRLPERGMAAR